MKHKIIINDSNCSDTFINTVVNLLKEKNIDVLLKRNSKDIILENSIVITLDQQYSSGPNTIIMAPFNNNIKNNSDVLALAFEKSLKDEEIKSIIQCGKTGYKLAENGSVFEKLPSQTEEILKGTNNDFITICLGTRNIDAERVAKAINNAIKRFDYYLKKEDINMDLIYRAEKKDSKKSIADRFNTSEHELIFHNPYEKDTLLDDIAVLNPITLKIDAFNKNISELSI